MFQPFDGVLLASGATVSATYALVSTGGSLIASVAAAAVTGCFVVIAKVVELLWRSYKENKRVQRLERQLLDAGLKPSE